MKWGKNPISVDAVTIGVTHKNLRNNRYNNFNKDTLAVSLVRNFTTLLTFKIRGYGPGLPLIALWSFTTCYLAVTSPLDGGSGK